MRAKKAKTEKRSIRTPREKHLKEGGQAKNTEKHQNRLEKKQFKKQQNNYQKNKREQAHEHQPEGTPIKAT